jgi:tetratricopeptide (TPR) repeat protein
MGLKELARRDRPSQFDTMQQFGEELLAQILTEADAKGINVKCAGEAGEGPNLSAKTRMAKMYLAYGSRKDAERVLERAVSEIPEDSGASRLLAVQKKNDELDRMQKTHWDFVGRYVSNPFSRFNLCILAGFHICQHERLTVLRGFGERCVDYALAMRPDSPDAHLLKGWYYYLRDRPEDAVKEAGRASELAPENARAWIGLCFFFAKANQREEAFAAYKKMIEVYPGYPHQAEVLAAIAMGRG